MTNTTHRLKFRVRYDGTDYAGWQIQPDARTIQGDIESALSQIAGGPIRIHGAGRTDAGVHALGQVFHCDWPVGKDYERLPKALSQMLGPAVRVDSAALAAADFHARYSATGKRYTYVLDLSRQPDPFTARYAWHLNYEVDMERVGALAERFVGAHDFAGYQCSGVPGQPTFKTIHAARVLRGGVVGPQDNDQLWRVEFYGSGFLYKMVRNLVGTIMDVARGRFAEDVLEERLQDSGPYRGHTAPAHGLFLVAVDYENT